MGELLADVAFTAGEGGSAQGVDVLAHVQRDAGQGFDEGLEGFVAGDEVGLGVHLDHGGAVLGGDDADQALGGGAAGFLGGLAEALLAQPVDGAFQVAVGLGERLLAIHHAGAGLFAQGFHEEGGDFGHLGVVSGRKARPSFLKKRSKKLLLRCRAVFQSGRRQGVKAFWFFFLEKELLAFFTW